MTAPNPESGRVIDVDSITDREWWEIGRRAVEDLLVEMRDDRISVMGRNNGLVICERDGSPSDVIRLPIEAALKVGVRAIADARAAQNDGSGSEVSP